VVRLRSLQTLLAADYFEASKTEGKSTVMKRLAKGFPTLPWPDYFAKILWQVVRILTPPRNSPATAVQQILLDAKFN